MIENGFQNASIRIEFVPKSSAAGFTAADRPLAAILRGVPGDACMQLQGCGNLGLVRRNGVVYVNPDQLRPEDLTENGYVPERLVVGIPAEVAAWTAAQT